MGLITKMKRHCNIRLRSLLLLACLASCLMAFSAVRCSLFNISCSSETLTSLANLDKYENLDHIFNIDANSVPSGKAGVTFRNFSEAVKKQADKNGVIILVSTDYGYIEMALNLYYTSFKKLKITNYLFVCSDKEASKVLEAKGIAHIGTKEDRDGKTVSAYGSAAFKRKTHIKSRIIYEALKLGYKVLISDVDIVFLKNPIPYFNCTECDIEIQSDGGEGNSGFYFVKPTDAGIKLHKQALHLAAKYPSLSNQKALAKALSSVKTKSKTLPSSIFPYGMVYFENGHRMFAGDNPCKECVIVHDNWIVSGAAKVYRFKEHLMWWVDTDQYYTNPDNKYITYDNPFDFGSKQTVSKEIEALKSALSIAFLSKRILILPDFACYGCKFGACRAKRCSLNTHIRIAKFDAAFGKKYREHTFLRHPLVPKTITDSVPAPIIIQSSEVMAKLPAEKLAEMKYKFEPADKSKGATSAEILAWLKPLENQEVIRFHSMYNAFSKFEPEHLDEKFSAALKSGLSRAGYRQY